MGAGGSQLLQSLPDHCTREHVRSVAGSLYDEEWFCQHVVLTLAQKEEVVAKQDLLREAQERGIFSHSQMALYHLNRWKQMRQRLTQVWESFPAEERQALEAVEEVRQLKPLHVDPTSGDEEFDGGFRQQSSQTGLQRREGEKDQEATADVLDKKEEAKDNDGTAKADGNDKEDDRALVDEVVAPRVVQTVEEHKEVASEFIDPLYSVMVQALQAAQLPTDPYDTETHKGTLLFPRHVKSLNRMRIKAQTEYHRRKPGPGASWIMDAVRGSVILDTPAQAVALVHCLEQQQQDKVEVVRLKNRFQKALFHGYRDMLLNLRLLGETSYICEVQIHLRSLLVPGKEMRSHEVYEYFRFLYQGNLTVVQERLECLIQADNDSDEDYGTCQELVDTVLARVQANPPLEQISRVQNLALLLHDLGEQGLEIRLRRYVVDLLQDTESTDHHGELLPDALNDLAWAHFTQGEYPQARAAFEEALEWLAGNSNTEDGTLSTTTKRHQARALEGKGLTVDKQSANDQEREEALTFLNDAIELYRECKTQDDDEDGRLLSLAMANKAMVLMKLLRLDEAHELYSQALDLQKAGDSTLWKRDLARTLNNRGASYLAAERWDEAAESFQSALSIRLEIYGPLHRNVAMTLANLAQVDERRGHLAAAVQSRRQVVDMQEAVFGPQHAQVALALEACARVCVQRTDNKESQHEALELYQRALEIRQACTLDSNEAPLPEIRHAISKLQGELAGVPRQAHTTNSEEKTAATGQERPLSMKMRDDGILAFPDSTVLFCDICNFSEWSAQAAQQGSHAGEMLQAWFGKLRSLLSDCPGARQVPTTGDTFMAWTGAEKVGNPRHADEMLRLALRITHLGIPFMVNEGFEKFTVRVGFHSGETFLGQLRGEESPFEVYGDTVNTAWRMQEMVPPGGILWTQSTMSLLKSFSSALQSVKKELEYLTLEVKGKGEVPLVRLGPSVIVDKESLTGMDSFLLEHRKLQGLALEREEAEASRKQFGAVQKAMKFLHNLKEARKAANARAKAAEEERRYFEMAMENVGGCINASARILMASGEYKAAKDIQVGDVVATSLSTAVVEAHIVQKAAPRRRLVQIHDNLLLSTSHRIQSPTGVWIKPHYHPSAVILPQAQDVELHNFVTRHTSQSLVVEGGIVISTLGQYCPPSHYRGGKATHSLWTNRRLLLSLLRCHEDWPRVTLEAEDAFWSLCKDEEFASSLVAETSFGNENTRKNLGVVLEVMSDCTRRFLLHDGLTP